MREVFHVVATAAAVFLLTAGSARPESSLGVPAQQADNCTACHAKESDGVVELFKLSTHARPGRSCSACHGGDATARDKMRAHSARFTGKPAQDQLLAMCASCHRSQTAMFKASRHFNESKRSARPDCTDCHGSHTIGSPRREFSFFYYCSGCHGLEYLPKLPDMFQRVMASSDDVADAIRALELSGRTLSADATALRREIRRTIGDIVHRTDLAGALERAPQVIDRINALARIVDKERTKR